MIRPIISPVIWIGQGDIYILISGIEVVEPDQYSYLI
jgi:hypothetical protein